jgi:hypothetical protein
MLIKRFYFSLYLFFCLAPLLAHGSEPLQFDCHRTERNYAEDYVLVVVPASKTQSKPKVYLDGRDLDQSDAGGHQEVKSVVITSPLILIAIDAKFDSETVEGVLYPAGTAATQITLNRSTGVLKKIETIKGGILGATLGEGTKIYEEKCVPSKLN